MPCLRPGSLIKHLQHNYVLARRLQSSKSTTSIKVVTTIRETTCLVLKENPQLLSSPNSSHCLTEPFKIQSLGIDFWTECTRRCESITLLNFMNLTKTHWPVLSKRRRHHLMIQLYTEHLYDFVQQHKKNSSLPLDQAHSTKSFLVMAAAHSHRYDW